MVSAKKGTCGLYVVLRNNSILGFLASLLLIFSLPASANAQFTFTTNNGAITITGYSPTNGILTIPSHINGYPVTTIGENAFNCNYLTSVILPDTLTTIGVGAFGGGIYLTNVTFGSNVTTIGDVAFSLDDVLSTITIPQSVTNIGINVFSDCACLTNISVDPLNPVFSSLDGVLFNKDQTELVVCPSGITGTYTTPNSVKTFGKYAFSSCVLTSVIFPTNMTSLGAFAFCESGLTNIIIPAMVTNIGADCFDDCPFLTSVDFLGIPPTFDGWDFFGDSQVTEYYYWGTPGWTNATYPGLSIVGWNGPWPFNYTITNGAVAIIGSINFLGSSAVSNSLDIPSTIRGFPVTSIQDFAFAYCSGLTSVTIPNSVVSLGDGVFSDCQNLTNVIFSTDLTSLGSFTFANCSNLTSIILPNNLTTIGDLAFYSCENLSNIDFGTSLTNIGMEVFEYCPRLASLVLPDSLTTLGDQSFNYCQNLTTIEIPSGLTNLGYLQFDYSPNLTNIDVSPLNPAYSSVGGVLFDKSQTTLIECPPGISGNYLIPNSVTNVQFGAFVSCSNLTNIAVPRGVAYLDGFAFRDCPNLTNVSVDPLNPDYSSLGGILYSKDLSALILFPAGKSGGCSIPTNVNYVGDFAFYSTPNLTNIAISANITNIGYAAFAGCIDLTNISVSPFNQFYCSQYGVLFDKNLTTLIQFPAGKAGSYSIPDGITTLGDWSFYAASNLVNLTVPASITGVGNDVFDACSNLTAVYFKGNALSDEGYFIAFYNENSVNLYYLPGTTGWDFFSNVILNNIKIAPWHLPQPLILNSAANSGTQSNQFGFTISWATNATVVVEACTNLANPVWLPIQTNSLNNGTNYFSDPQWLNNSRRYFRLHAL